MAIVTGAGTGIGKAIAHKFAQEGAKVIVSGLPEDPLKRGGERGAASAPARAGGGLGPGP